jgi:hypothetical protein
VMPPRAAGRSSRCPSPAPRAGGGTISPNTGPPGGAAPARMILRRIFEPVQTNGSRRRISWPGARPQLVDVAHQVHIGQPRRGRDARVRSTGRRGFATTLPSSG